MSYITAFFPLVLVKQAQKVLCYNVPLLLCNVFHCNNVFPNKVEKIFTLTLIMAETSPKGINKISFSTKQMPYRKGFCYSKTKRFCENKMKAGQKGIITKKQGETVRTYSMMIFGFV